MMMTRVVFQVMVVLWATLSTEFVLGIGRHRGFDVSGVRLLWLQLAGVAVFSLLVHETGHWLAGRAVGWRCLTFRIGPFKLVHLAAGWRIKWNKLDFGGGVACYPPSFDGFAKSITWFTAGGPLASILQGVLFGFAAWSAHSLALFWIFAFASHFGFGFAVVSLVPMKFGFQLSDGAKLVGIFRGGKPVEELRRMYLINISYGTALRPRDWAPEIIQPVLESLAPCSRHDRYLAYIHLLDSEGAEAAYPWLALFAPGWSKADPYEYAVEATYYLGVFDRDPAGAALWLARAMKDKTISPADRRLAEAAVACAAGRTDEAERLARAALTKLDEELSSGLVEYRRARLNYLLEHIVAEPAPVVQPTQPDAIIVG